MTNSNGKEILESLRQFKRFYGDCALLLKTGEAAFIEAGWQNATGNTAIADLSKSIEWPDWWPPYYAFRYFKNDHCKSLIAFLSIIFDLPEEPARIIEPLISAGLLDYEEKAVGAWEYWYATLHAWMPERQDDGTLNTMDPKRELDGSYELSHLKTLAVPLVSISNTQGLKDKVIQPIFNELAKYQPMIQKGSANQRSRLAKQQS